MSIELLMIHGFDRSTATSGVSRWRLSARSKKARSRCARRRAFGILVWVCLLRRTGHCRQHAMRMVMVVPAMLPRKDHL